LDSTNAAKAESGDAFVRLGELYYGFGEYELAVASIERGLEKGHVQRLDEAYVYLGRSEVAIGDLDAARDAFAKLKDVAGISPRVLDLWTLYAETRLSSRGETSALSAECNKVGP
jgi:tetratricopeptide (TPR) repeat protein